MTSGPPSGCRLKQQNDGHIGSQTRPMGVETCSHVYAFFCANNFA